jgi:hypothetical protein
MGPSKFFGILDGMGWDAVGGMLSRFRLISVWVPGLERVCFCPAPAASRGRGRKNAKVRKCSARFGEGLRDREGLPKICAKFGASGCTWLTGWRRCCATPVCPASVGSKTKFGWSSISISLYLHISISTSLAHRARMIKDIRAGSEVLWTQNQTKNWSSLKLCIYIYIFTFF